MSDGIRFGSTGNSRRMIPFGDHSIPAVGAQQSTISTYEHRCGGCDQHHGEVVIAFDPIRTVSTARAVYLSLTPEKAREYAAMILNCADQAEGVAGALQ